jgi:hypothetical protein
MPSGNRAARFGMSETEKTASRPGERKRSCIRGGFFVFPPYLFILLPYIFNSQFVCAVKHAVRLVRETLRYAGFWTFPAICGISRKIVSGTYALSLVLFSVAENIRRLQNVENSAVI